MSVTIQNLINRKTATVTYSLHQASVTLLCSLSQISSDSVSTKNIIYLFFTPCRISCLFPWQRPANLLVPQPKPLEHLYCRHLAVQRVEMDARDVHVRVIYPRCKQSFAHLHSLVNAKLSDGLVIFFDGVDGVDDLLRNLQLGQADNVTQGLVGLWQERVQLAHNQMSVL